ncbi:MAG: nucleotide-binding protein [Methanothrix sp.]|nr:nucleotide-binding protein [Methanothrix sp.]
MKMEKQKEYLNTYFPPEVIIEALNILSAFIEDGERKFENLKRSIKLKNGEIWSHDTDEEFFADYRKPFEQASFGLWLSGTRFYFYTFIFGRDTQVTIRAPERHQIEASFEIFEKNAERCKLQPLPEKPKPKPIIFIGHGGSEQWRNLKDHLHEKHDYRVEAYEIGARAGHAIRDILEEMLGKTSFAILVMTGEDKTEDGGMRARQNVVHELGLFQGKLGFTKAIVLLEDGTEEFSNIHGINQIRYGKGNIKETFGEVLATLKREFGRKNSADDNQQFPGWRN